MKKIALDASLFLALALPFAASAHEMATYNIGGSMYQIVIGSLGEPVVVDDRTGVDLTVSKCATSSCAPTMSPDGGLDGPAGTPVMGLDQTLKVELIAGDQKKTLSLVPQETDGKYTALFYPTMATTLSYHLTGTIANTAVDFTYTCIPAGTPKAAENKTSIQLSKGVTQMSMSGGFGCPQAKTDFGFPDKGMSVGDVSSSAQSANSIADVAAVLGLIGVALGGYALMRRKN